MVLKPITKNEIVNALHSVDLTKGHTVMVHTLCLWGGADSY